MWFGNNAFRLPGLAFLVMLLQACATAGFGPPEDLLSSVHKIDEVEVSANFKRDAPGRIAVLPFANQTVHPEAAEIVRHGFYNHFASKRYRDMELHQIDAILKKNGIYENQGFMKMSPPALGKLLEADGLMFGVVTDFDRVFLCAYSQVYVSLEAKLVKAPSGKVLWRGRHRAAQHEGSIPFTPFGVVPALIRTALNVRDIELVRTTDDLCRTMVSAMPDFNIGSIRTTQQSLPVGDVPEKRKEKPADKTAHTRKDSSVIAHLKKQADAQMRGGQTKECVQTLLKILVTEPNNPDIHFLTGMAYHQNKQPDDAVMHMTKAAELDPMNAGFHYNLGLARIESGDLKGAVLEWEKVMVLDPGNHSARVLLELYGGDKENSSSSLHAW